MSVLDEIFNKLSMFKGFYDDIRVVDPVKKRIVDPDSKETCNKPCYNYWGNGAPCKNCICIKSLTKDSVFVKIENKDSDVFLAFSCPINVDDKLYIVEVSKAIIKNGLKNTNNANELVHFKNIINKLNNTIVNGISANS